MENNPNKEQAMTTTHAPTDAPKVAWDRDESEPCQRGTVGCCIDHNGERQDSCETW